MLQFVYRVVLITGNRSIRRSYMKTNKRVLLTSVLIMALLFLGNVHSQARTTWVSGMNGAGRKLTVAFKDTSQAKQVQLLTRKGKLVKEAYVKKSCAFRKLRKNRLYYYRYRYVSYDEAGRTYRAVSSWSVKRPVSTFRIKVKHSDGEIVFKVPKTPGIKKYRLYISTRRHRGYKKEKTLRPGTQVRVDEVKGEELVKYKLYFYQIVAITKKGKKAENYYSIYNHYFFLDDK